jgi:hypothetical protein
MESHSVDYATCTVRLSGSTFQLARGRAGQVSVIDADRRRVIGHAVVGADRKVAGSNETVELVVLAWLGHCLRHDLEPWPST